MAATCNGQPKKIGLSNPKKKKERQEEWERICRLTRKELEAEFQQKGQEAWEKAWEILHTKDGWKKEAGACLEEGIVYSQNFRSTGKLFKLEAVIQASPQLCFEELVLRAVDAPTWNQTISECAILQTIDESTDICYNVAAEAAGGLVSSRDFVNLRHWDTKDNIILSAGCTVMHPDAPPSKKHVRGENRPGGWVFLPVEDDPNKCLFCWIVNTDLKGWIPQYVVDQALSGTLLEFTRHMRTRMVEVRNAAVS